MNLTSDEMLTALRNEAKSSGGGGGFVRLDNKGEFVQGVVVRREEDEAPFGTVEQLILNNVRTHEGVRDPEDEVSFRLSRSVLRREFGSEAEDGGAVAGMIIFCEAQGEAMSKAGKPYFRYSCVKKKPEDAQAAAAAVPKGDLDAAVKAAEALGGTVEKDDIPF